MKKGKKIWLIIAAALVIVGSLIFAGAFAALDFDFDKLSTQKYETNTYEISGDFDKISISVNTTELKFRATEDEKCRVECFEEEKIKHNAIVQDGELTIYTVDTRKWSDHIGIFTGNTKMVVYLPENEYDSLLIDTDTGNVEIPTEISFDSVKISGSSANIDCYTSASNNIEISTDTGDINLDALYAKDVQLTTDTGNININSTTAEGIFDVETDTGRVCFTDVACKSLNAESDTGGISLKNVIAAAAFSIKSDTGDVRFENSDAAYVSVKTSTGDVTGTLLSEKIFITDTSTGDINVPKTVTGGKCEITTDTGDIRIDVQ